MLPRTAHLIYLTTLALLMTVLVFQSRHDQPGTAEPTRRAENETAAPSVALTSSTAGAEDDADLAQLAWLQLPDSFDSPQPAPAGSAAHAKPRPSATAEKLDPAALKSLAADRPGAEIIVSCIEVARDVDRDLGEQLARKRTRNPQAFDAMMGEGQTGRRLIAMAQLKQRDPELYQVKLAELIQAVQINRLATEAREAIGKGDVTRAEALREQLHNLLQIQLAMSLKARAEYLCRIEDQVQTVRDELNFQGKNFRATVEARLQQLLQESGAHAQPAANGAVPVVAHDAAPAEPAEHNQ